MPALKTRVVRSGLVAPANLAARFATSVFTTITSVRDLGDASVEATGERDSRAVGPAHASNPRVRLTIQPAPKWTRFMWLNRAVADARRSRSRHERRTPAQTGRRPRDLHPRTRSATRHRAHFDGRPRRGRSCR